MRTYKLLLELTLYGIDINNTKDPLLVNLFEFYRTLFLYHLASKKPELMKYKEELESALKERGRRLLDEAEKLLEFYIKAHDFKNDFDTAICTLIDFWRKKAEETDDLDHFYDDLHDAEELRNAIFLNEFFTFMYRWNSKKYKEIIDLFTDVLIKNKDKKEEVKKKLLKYWEDGKPNKIDEWIADKLVELDLNINEFIKILESKNEKLYEFIWTVAVMSIYFRKVVREDLDLWFKPINNAKKLLEKIRKNKNTKDLTKLILLVDKFRDFSHHNGNLIRSYLFVLYHYYQYENQIKEVGRRSGKNFFTWKDIMDFLSSKEFTDYMNKLTQEEK